MFKELFESKDYVLYNTDTKELWVTYGQGSGITTYLPDITKYLTDKRGERYDSIVPRILRWAKLNKPMKKVKNTMMFEIPMYRSTKSGTYDIHGGDLEPVSKMYMIITQEKDTIINFFNNKNEATTWMKSIKA